MIAGSLLAISLGAGTFNIIAKMNGGAPQDMSAAYAAIPASQIAASAAGGMGINEFLLASRASRFLPPARVWWHRKGDHNAFAAIAPKPEADEPGDAALPPEVAPVAFAAVAPTDTGLGDSDIAPPVPQGTEQRNPSIIPTRSPAPTGPTGGFPPGQSTPPVSLVPEPSSWALMFCGMAAIAWMMRRRRSATASHSYG